MKEQQLECLDRVLDFVEAKSRFFTLLVFALLSDQKAFNEDEERSSLLRS